MNASIHTIKAGLSDREIIERVMAGEKNLYASLIQRYNQRLYRVAMSILVNDNEAEEAMQSAYIKGWENLSQFTFKSAYSTWLTRILINEALLLKKKRERVKEVSSENYVSNETGHSNLQTPFMKLANSELKKFLEKAVAALPEKYRTVFMLREIEQMPVSETGECLGLSAVNVKVRLNRAKAMLRDYLSKVYKEDELFSFHLSRCERITNSVMSYIIESN